MSLVTVSSPADSVRVVHLNRPDRLNAMSIDLVIELYDALEEVAADNSCHGGRAHRRGSGVLFGDWT